MTDTQLGYWRNQEEIRHNIVSESELGRHNVAQEGIGMISAKAQVTSSNAQARNAETNAKNASTQRGQMIVDSILGILSAPSEWIGNVGKGLGGLSKL